MLHIRTHHPGPRQWGRITLSAPWKFFQSLGIALIRFFFFFNVDLFFKSLLYLLQYCFYFMFWFFGLQGCGILARHLGVEPRSPALEGGFLTTGSPGKLLIHYFFMAHNSPWCDFAINVLTILLSWAHFFRLFLLYDQHCNKYLCKYLSCWCFYFCG